MVFGESLVKSVDSSLEPIVVLAVTFVASKGLVKGSGTVTESITVVVAVPASVSVGGEVIISTVSVIPDSSVVVGSTETRVSSVLMASVVFGLSE